MTPVLWFEAIYAVDVLIHAERFLFLWSILHAYHRTLVVVVSCHEPLCAFPEDQTNLKF